MNSAKTFVTRLSRSLTRASLWKILFAAAAIADMTTCWPVLVEGWSEEDSSSSDACNSRSRKDNGTSTGSCASSPLYWASSAGPYYSLLRIWIGPVFCFLCAIEAIIRAKEARTLAIENHALDNVEKSLQRVYSTTRMSFRRFGAASNVDALLARSTIRTWIPVGVTIFFWLSLLPLSRNYRCGSDAALATRWIATTYTHYLVFTEWAQEAVSSTLWKVLFPFKISQPRRFYRRLRQVLSLIRWIRFAGPLLRMCLKLGDQFWALTKTSRQKIAVQTEKAKRLACRSMLFDDIKRVESLAKVQTALAALPSQLFNMAHDQISPEISSALQKQQEEGRKIRRQIQQLRKDISRNFETTEIHDRVVQMTQELKVKLSNTLLSSHHLISPHSRFSVVWRMTVTNCLLLEIFRLSVSWHLSKTFKISLTQVISRLLIECDHPEMTKHFAFITDRVDDIRKQLSNVIPLLPPPDDLTICVPSSPSAKIFLQLGGMLESFIDVVSFLDIFIWWLTGELDVVGVIIPKPFFSRCILPGTLVQILDHPTLPETLPNLISHAMDAASNAGWSRVIRWVLAVVPACVMLVVNPLKSYFFRHMETTEGIMRYAESCGLLTPARPSESHLRGINSRPSQMGMPSNPSIMGNLYPVQSHPSQIGMSVDSPTPGPRKVSMSIDESLELPPSILRHSNLHLSLNSLDDDYNFSYSRRSLQDLHED